MHPSSEQCGIPASAKVRPRKRFKWTRRFIVAGAMLILAVAALPKVTSGPRLAGAIANIASGNANLPVRIADAQWGWWGGLDLSGIKTQLPDKTNVTIDNVRIETSVWDIVQGRDLRDVRVDGLTVDLAVNQQPAAPQAGAAPHSASPGTGISNGTGDATALPAGAASQAVYQPTSQAAPPDSNRPATTRAANLMKERKPGKESPINSIPVDKVVLSRCVANVSDEATGRTTRVFLPAVQVDLDRRTGAVSWRMSAKIDDHGLVASEGNFILQRLAIVPKEFGGWMQVTWSDLSLGDLPTGLLRRMNLQELGGSTDGRVKLRLTPDWTLLFAADAAVKNAVLQNERGGSARLSKAAAGISGLFRMIDQKVEVQEAWAELPGAKVKASGPALVYDGNQVLRSSVTGTIEDATVLRAALADVGVRLPAELELAGKGSFEAHVDRQQEGTRVELGGRGEGLSAFWPGVFHRKAGSPLEVKAVCDLGDDGSIVLKDGQVRLPGGSVMASAEVASVPSGSSRALVLRQTRAELRWDDLETLAGQLPAVSLRLASAGSVRGPGGAQIWATMNGLEGMTAGASMTLPEQAEVALGDLLHKPAGRDLRFEMRTSLSPGFDSLGVDHIAIESGEETLVRVQDLRATVSKQMLSEPSDTQSTGRRAASGTQPQTHGPASRTMAPGVVPLPRSMAANDAAMAPAGDAAVAPAGDAAMAPAGDAAVGPAGRTMALGAAAVPADRDRMTQRPIMLVDVRGALARLDLSGLQEVSPALAEAIGRVGRVGGTIRGRTAVSYWADISARRIQPLGIDVASELDLEQAAVRVEGVLDKKAGEKLQLSGSYADHWGGQGRKGYGYGSASIEAEGFSGQGWYERSPSGPGPVQWAWGWLDVDDIRRTTSLLPAVAEIARHDELAGRMTSRLEWSRQSDSFDLRTLLDLTGTQGRLVQAGIRKPAGLPAMVDVLISGPAGKGAGRQWRLPEAEVRLGESRASITDGAVEMSEPWAKLLAGEVGEAFAKINFTWPVRSARAKVSGVTVFGESPVSQDLETLLSRLRATGPVQWTFDWSYEFPKGVEFAANVQAGALAVATGPLDKTAGVPLQADIKGKAGLSYDEHNVPHVRFQVTDAAGTVSNLEWKAQGEALCRVVGGEFDLLSAKFSGGGDSRQLDQLLALVPPVRPWQVKGHAAWESTCSFEKERGWRLDDADIGLWPVQWDLAGTPCGLAGLVNVQQGGEADADGAVPGLQVSATGLAAKVGETEGRFTFHGERDGNGVSGELDTAFAMIDVDELLGLYKKVGQASRAGGNGDGNGGHANVNEEQLTAATQAAGSQPADLMGGSFNFMGQTEGLRLTLEKGRDPINLRLLSWDGSLAGGDLKVDLVGAFEGGALTAQVSGRADGAGPVKIRYRADRALPTTFTKYMVERSFPGMRVDGPVTLDETLLIEPASKEPAIPTSGEMIVEGGEVTGAAAPRAVQRLFPGLQLARFKFSRLHNWYEKDSQGKTVNRMIYRGSPWSMYMSGWSQADGTFQYEIGVDLMGPIESEYWAAADRGRVPLFIKTGRVIDGKMHDEVIRYLYPQQILARIFKDNLVTIAYEAVRQRVTGGKAGTADKVAN